MGKVILTGFHPSFAAAAAAPISVYTCAVTHPLLPPQPHPSSAEPVHPLFHPTGCRTLGLDPIFVPKYKVILEATLPQLKIRLKVQSSLGCAHLFALD